MQSFKLFLVSLFLFSSAAYAPIQLPDYYLIEVPPPLEEVHSSKVLTVEDIVRYGTELNFFNPELLASIAKIESGYQTGAKSLHKGIAYYGLMQMSYGTAQMLGFEGEPSELMDWRVNLKYAAIYLQQLIDQHGDLEETIAAYNAGTVYYCQKKCPKGQLVNQEYVNNVMKVYKELKTSES